MPSPPLEAGALPLVHRLVLLYLALPVAIWLVGWLEWWVGVPAVLALALALRDALRGSWRVSISRRDLTLALIALAWVLATPAGGVLAGEHGDWLSHRAMFLDLGRGEWPAYVTDHLWNEPPLLRYYLGYYLAPALLGKWLGAAALNWAVPLWTWIGVALLTRLFTRNFGTARGAAAAALALICFSGMDTISYLLRYALFGLGELSSKTFFIEGWEWAYPADRPDSYAKIDYQSHAMTFGHSPHHFLTGGLGALLLFQLRHSARFLAAIGVVFVACLFWSPLTTVGLLALAIALVVGNGIRPFLNWRNLLAAPLVAAPVVLYLASGKTDSASQWLPSFYEHGYRFAADLGLAYCGEFLLLAFFLWRMRPGIARDPFFVASLCVLVLAPWRFYGDVSGLSESLIRLPIGPLLLLCYYAVHALAEHRDKRSGRPTRPVAAGALLTTLALGAPSAIAWHLTYFNERRAAPYEESSRSLIVDLQFLTIAQRTTPSPSGALGAMLRDHQHKGAPLGETLFQSALQPLDTVFFWENRLVFATRRDCDRNNGSNGNRFLLRFRASAQAPDNKTFHEVRDFSKLSIQNDKGYGDCVVSRALPPHPIERVTLGRIVNGRLTWLTRIPFDGHRPAGGETSPQGKARYRIAFDNTARRKEAEYADLVATPPAARGHWDVFLLDRAIAYAKRPCVAEETRGRFFLHATPLAASDLPSDRGDSGFVNLDFGFADGGGVVFNGKCMVRRELPEYALRGLSTGQLAPASSRPQARAWQVELAVAPAAREPQLNGGP